MAIILSILLISGRRDCSRWKPSRKAQLEEPVRLRHHEYLSKVTWPQTWAGGPRKRSERVGLELRMQLNGDLKKGKRKMGNKTHC